MTELPQHVSLHETSDWERCEEEEQRADPCVVVTVAFQPPAHDFCVVAH